MERGNKGFTLTEDGQLMLEAVREVLSTYDAALSGLSTRRSDIRMLEDYPGKLAVSPVCMHAIIAPLMKRGLLGNVGVREIDGLQAGRYADKGGWTVLADVPRFAVDAEAFDEAYEIVPVVKTRVGVMGLKAMLPTSASSISTEDAAKLPLGLFDNETTRCMYETIFEEHPMRDVESYTTNIDVLTSNAERGRYAILADSFQWRQYLLGRPSSDMAFIPVEGRLESVFGFVFPKGKGTGSDARELAASLCRVFHDMVSRSDDAPK